MGHHGLFLTTDYNVWFLEYYTSKPGLTRRTSVTHQRCRLELPREPFRLRAHIWVLGDMAFQDVGFQNTAFETPPILGDLEVVEAVLRLAVPVPVVDKRRGLHIASYE